MPPKGSATSAPEVSDPDNEVVCPIKSQDGSKCRKKCLGEKRFRSMQEHIRRAHPEYYIPKLPATKESFELMVNSPPQERPPKLDAWSPTSAPRPHPRQLPSDDQYAVSDLAGLSYAPILGDVDLFANMNSFGKGAGGPVQSDGYYNEAMGASSLGGGVGGGGAGGEHRRSSFLPAANAAAALASLHYARPDGEWENDQNFFADHVPGAKRAHFVDPTLGPDQQFLDDRFQQQQQDDDRRHTPSLLPSTLAKSPPSRSNTLPPMQRSVSHQSRTPRPRKPSLSQSARKAKHERAKANGHLRNTSADRAKALSAEPNMYGKRWEDLIEAATSATDEESRDLTPMPVSPYRSPQVLSRTSLPPFALGSQFQSYTASPLQQTLTPPPAEADGPPLQDLHPFPSVEGETDPSSMDSTQSGANFHIMPSGASDSSPMFSNPVQIYCAGCRRVSILKDSYACPECICGLCQQCVETLIGEQNRGRIAQCPSCRTMGGRFKRFQLDLR